MDTQTLKKFAKLLCHYSLEVEKEETVVIQSTKMALPLMKEIFLECLNLGAYPRIDMEIEGLIEMEFMHGSIDYFKYVSPFYQTHVKEVNKLIKIHCPYNTWSMSGIDLNKHEARTIAQSNYRQILKERERNKEYHWCVTAYPCNSAAQNAKMSLIDYENYILKGIFLDKDDPELEWKKQIKQELEYIDFLKNKKILSLKGKNADLTFSIEGRPWVHSEAKCNNPDGEIFTAPIENSINGWINYDYPGALFGQEVRNIRFEYKNGKVVKANADKGIEAVNRMLNLDNGMKYVGEFAIATNYQIDKFIDNGLFDEKRGGTIHIANGDTLEGTGGLNKAPVHWDNITTFFEGEIMADGKVFYKDGQFLI